MKHLLVLALSLSVASLVDAQWLNYPTPGIPRLTDGKPNLDAPSPRLPDGRVDFSGMWRINAPGTGHQDNIATGLAEVPMQPWAAQLYGQRKLTHAAEHPRVRCLPRGIPNAMVWHYGPFKIRHLSEMTVMLFEEFVTYRQIYTDGRPLPADPDPTWWGYSVGSWEPDSLVVTTAGFKDNNWLDFEGHPATDGMRITEIFRRSSFGKMQIEFRFDDPKAYTRPWSVSVPFDYMADTDFIEHVCENEKNSEFILKK